MDDFEYFLIRYYIDNNCNAHADAAAKRWLEFTKFKKEVLNELVEISRNENNQDKIKNGATDI